MTVADHLKRALDWVERRQHPRTGSSRLTLKIDGQKYKTVDWSLGGCRIQAPAADAFRLQQRVTGRLRLADADGPGDFVAEIVRIEADGQVALRWLELSPQIFVAMSR